MPDWDNEKTDDLARALLSLKNINEAKRFLRDLLTEQEIIEFGNRWRVAQMLNSQISYSQIEKDTGMSSTTIARVSKWLNDGMDGYKLMLQRLHCHCNSSSFGKGLR